MAAGNGVLLVNPCIHDFAAYNLWLRPLGLIDLYGFLAGAGIRTSYVDALFPTEDEALKYNLTRPESKKYHTGKFPEARIQKPPPYRNIPRHYRRFGIPIRALMERFQKIPRPECVLMTSGMTYWYPGVRETVSVCKEVFPDVPVVLGGVYATLCASHAGRHSGADTVLPGPWGLVLREVLRGRFGIQMSPPDTACGETSREAELYPGSGFGVVRLGEGCPFSCGYCASSLLSEGCYKFSPCDVYGEIARKAGGGCRDIAFYDDALLAGAEDYLIPLLKLISAGRPDCRFHTPNGLHARWMTPEIAALFMECRFRTVRLSFDRPGKDSSGLKASAAHLRRAGRALEDAGYSPGEVEVYTLIGLNGQKDEEVLETFGIVRDFGFKILPAYYSPVPGTPFFEEDCLKAPEIRDEPLLHNSSAAAMWDYDMERYDRLKKIASE